ESPNPDPEPTTPPESPDPTTPPDPSPSPTSEPDPSPTTSPTSDPEPEFSCAVAATAEDPWLFGFDAVVTLTNTSERTLLGWRSAFTLPSGYRADGARNAELVEQDGNS